MLGEAFFCDYDRNGWIQARDPDDQDALRSSVEFGERLGADDWTTMSPDDVRRAGGMRVDAAAGFIRHSATFHPARWVWCLLTRALQSTHVSLYTRTKVLGIDRLQHGYRVCTYRGDIHARAVINTTESYTAALHPSYGEFISPVQTQAAWGKGGPPAMPPHIALSGKRAFFGRHPFDNRQAGIMVGSDATRVASHQAGRNAPSRFITAFCLGELWRYYEPAPVEVTHEWSGTLGFTVDEFPVVGRLDGHDMWIIGDMFGSGTAVSFNGSRHVVTRVLGLPDERDDYPEAYFSPSRLLDPSRHVWPEVQLMQDKA